MAIPNRLAKARVVAKRKMPGLEPIIRRLAYKGQEGLNPRLVINARAGLLYNQKEVEAGKPPELAYDLANRVMHVAARHFDLAEQVRREDGEIDRALWGEMADISINPALIKAGFEPGVEADGTSRAKMPEDYGMPRGWGAKRYYREAKKRGIQAKNPEPEKQDGSGAGSPNPAEDAKEAAGFGPGKGALKLILAEWAKHLKDNAGDERVMRGLLPGDMPADLDITVKALTSKPVTDWKEEFRKVLGNSLITAPGWGQLTFNKRSKLQAAYGAQVVGVPSLPGKNTRLPKVMVVVDTSGSMSADLEAAKAEVSNIVEAYNAPVDFLTFDTRVHVFPRLRDANAARKTGLKGGGGTDITPVMDYIRGLPRSKRPRVVVTVTDGWVGDCGPAIPGVEYLWVLTHHGKVPATYGRVFRLPPLQLAA